MLRGRRWALLPELRGAGWDRAAPSAQALGLGGRLPAPLHQQPQHPAGAEPPRRHGVSGVSPG